MQLSIEQQHLVEDNVGLVHKVIKDRVRGVGIGIFSYEDLYQYGCIGLCKAAYTDKYHFAYNRENAHSEDEMRFSTYAYRLIWNEICTQLEYSTKIYAEYAADPDEVLRHIAKDHGDVCDETSDADIRITLERVLAEAEQSASSTVAKGIQAIRLNMEGHTSTEIARMMGGNNCHSVTAWISRARQYLKTNPELMSLMYNV